MRTGQLEMSKNKKVTENVITHRIMTHLLKHLSPGHAYLIFEQDFVRDYIIDYYGRKTCNFFFQITDIKNKDFLDKIHTEKNLRNKYVNSSCKIEWKCFGLGTAMDLDFIDILFGDEGERLFGFAKAMGDPSAALKRENYFDAFADREQTSDEKEDHDPMLSSRQAPEVPRKKRGSIWQTRSPQKKNADKFQSSASATSVRRSYADFLSGTQDRADYYGDMDRSAKDITMTRKYLGDHDDSDDENVLLHGSDDNISTTE